MKAFEAIVSPEDQEDVLLAISETISGWTDHDNVQVFDTDKLDAINVRASGSVTYKGKEYTFIAEDGNNAGFVMEDWDGGKVFEHCPRVKYALIPNPEARMRISMGLLTQDEAKRLLHKYETAKKDPPPHFQKLLSDYVYDIHFSPTIKIREIYREKAARLKAEIGTAEELDHIIETLKQQLKKG